MANKYLSGKKTLLQGRRDSNGVQRSASELRRLEVQYFRSVPLGRLLENGPGHLSSTASKNGKKGITQLRNISICKQDGLQKHLRHGSSHSSLAAKHQHRR
jgi:hypothetical protein